MKNKLKLDPKVEIEWHGLTVDLIDMAKKYFPKITRTEGFSRGFYSWERNIKQFLANQIAKAKLETAKEVSSQLATECELHQEEAVEKCLRKIIDRIYDEVQIQSDNQVYLDEVFDCIKKLSQEGE